MATMARWLVCALVIAAVCELTFAQVPCTSKGTPPGCDNTRWFPCGTYTGYNVIPARSNTYCGNVKNGVHRGDLYVVQFTSQTNICTEILMRVGECWGKNPINSGSYGCQGRCGPDCGTSYTCSNWAMDCLKHDVCSWYYGASGGSSDPHCGDEYNEAFDDWFTDCVFGTNWCELLNPTQSSTCCSTTSPPRDPGTCSSNYCNNQFPFCVGF